MSQADPMIRDWGLRLDGVELPKRTMDALVLDWLVNQGHCDAAQTFARECGTSADAVDANGITERVAIRQAVESGNIHTAIDAAQRLDSTIFSANPRLLFRLHRQQLIELIRSGDVASSLAYAHAHLAPQVEAEAELIGELEETMMLLASADLATSPSAHLLLPEQRRDVAVALNAAVLRAQAHEEEPALLVLLRALQWAQAELRGRMDVPYPVISDLVTAVPTLPSSPGAPLPSAAALSG